MTEGIQTYLPGGEPPPLPARLKWTHQLCGGELENIAETTSEHVTEWATWAQLTGRTAYFFAEMVPEGSVIWVVVMKPRMLLRCPDLDSAIAVARLKS